jgi:hypothetical protein
MQKMMVFVMIYYHSLCLLGIYFTVIWLQFQRRTGRKMLSLTSSPEVENCV